MAPKSRGQSSGPAAVLAKARARGTTPTPPGAAKGRAKAKAKALPAVTKVLSPQELAARRLQAAVRGLLARRLLLRLREARRQHEAEMAEAIRETEAALLRAERRKQQVVEKKNDAKKQKAKQRAADAKALLEAAFEPNHEAVQQMLDRGCFVDLADTHGTTALSEAAACGSMEVAKMLLEQRGNPNSQGEFKRTPLWRAAFAGHGELVTLLLESGSDPRIYDEQGQGPTCLCGNDDIIAELRDWDTTRTGELVEDYQAWVADLRFEEECRQNEAMRSVNDVFERAKLSHEAAQMMQAKAKSQLRDREKEYGLALAARCPDAIAACASADAELQRAEAAAGAAQRDFDAANLARMAAAEECGVEGQLPGREVAVLQLNNVLLRDLGERIAKGSQWPLLIDQGDIGKKFLQYSGSSVRNFFQSDEMDPERLRVALISMIRSGGVLAVDLFSLGSGVDLRLLAEPFDRIRAGLFDDLCSRKIIQIPKGGRWHAFQDLITKEEKLSRFRLESFEERIISKFKLVVLTSSEVPHQELLGFFDVLRVVMPT